MWGSESKVRKNPNGTVTVIGARKRKCGNADKLLREAEKRLAEEGREEAHTPQHCAVYADIIKGLSCSQLDELCGEQTSRNTQNLKDLGTSWAVSSSVLSGLAALGEAGIEASDAASKVLTIMSTAGYAVQKRPENNGTAEAMLTVQQQLDSAIHQHSRIDAAASWTARAAVVVTVLAAVDIIISGGTVTMAVEGAIEFLGAFGISFVGFDISNFVATNSKITDLAQCISMACFADPGDDTNAPSNVNRVK